MSPAAPDLETSEADLRRLAAQEQAAVCSAAAELSTMAPPPEDPLEVLGPVLARLRRSRPGERVWTGPGWHRVVALLDEKLAELDPDYELLEVKEKLAGLRYYAFPSSSQVDEAAFQQTVTEAEGVSRWLCEICGRPGRRCGTPSSGWVRTLCPTHDSWR